MRELQRPLLIFSALLLFLIGLAQTIRQLVYRFGDRHTYYRLQDMIEETIPSASIHLVWILVLALPICLFILWSTDLLSGKILALKTDSGHPLRISQSAVNRYIHDCLIALPYVQNIRIQTRSVRGNLAVSVKVWIAAADQIGRLQEAIYSQVIRDAKHGFGVTTVLDPQILIVSVAKPKPTQEGENLAIAGPEPKADETEEPVTETATHSISEPIVEPIDAEQSSASLDAETPEEEPAAIQESDLILSEETATFTIHDEEEPGGENPVEENASAAQDEEKKTEE